ncbi:hypothetical protein B4U80_07330 [Leptotrombidium deliense]|uniref:Uncharacterized protein n=1 Tax=Leptotrombidium deliense TaxID=299467 RepID=A0A443RZ45_9ACAR|nr:hypothetical protein B4U80_07330 [Leptotrombidium deliense]
MKMKYCRNVFLFWLLHLKQRQPLSVS